MEKNAFNSGDASLREALDRQTAAITAMLELQRELLQAVRELGENDPDQYREKMTVVNGGVL